LDETENMTAQTGAILALNGEFDVSQRDRLKTAFESVLGDSTVILDVTRTAFIDSTVLASLLRLRAEVIERGGVFVVAGSSVMLGRLFEITGLDQLFDLRPTLNDVEGSAGFRRVELISDES
jgi:anti-sigma B factor antagonist